MLHTTAPVTVRLDELRVVSTMIDGKGPYHFVLDTGAGITVITPELARRTGLEGSRSGQVTGSATVQVRTLTLQDVLVGRAEVRGVAAAVVPLPLDLTYQGDYGRIDGVLGYSFLSHYAVTIDMKDDVATFTQPHAYRKPPRAVGVRANLSDDTPIVDGRVDGIPGTFKIDTGDSGALTLTASFEGAHNVKARYSDGQPELLEGVGGVERALAIRAQTFTLAGVVIPNVSTSLSFTKTGVLGTATGNIGVDVLRRFTFTVDYAGHRVDFTPNRLLDSYVPYKATAVKATRQSNGTFRVIAVIPHSTGAKAGIRAGDVLIAINGDPLGSLSVAQVAEAMTADSVTYLVRSGERIRRVTLPLFDLLPARYVSAG